MESDQFAGLIAHLAEHEQELCGLQRASLESLLKTGEARAGRSSVPERAAFSRLLKRRGHALSCQQQKQLKAWEMRLCLSVSQQQFDKLVALLERKFKDLLSLQKNRLREMFNVHAAKHDPDIQFGKKNHGTRSPQLESGTT